MSKTQKEIILDSSAPTFQLYDAVYKGSNPVYVDENKDKTHLPSAWKRVVKGTPFIRITAKTPSKKARKRNKNLTQ